MRVTFKHKLTQATLCNPLRIYSTFSTIFRFNWKNISWNLYFVGDKAKEQILKRG